LPTLDTRYPHAQTCWPTKFCFHSPYVRARWIALLPAILMAVTPMVRLLVVFHFLRQALGTQTAPSNPTLPPEIGPRMLASSASRELHWSAAWPIL
jgi:hypothetical protein